MEVSLAVTGADAFVWGFERHTQGDLATSRFLSTFRPASGSNQQTPPCEKIIALSGRSRRMIGSSCS
jgi:hypothetical protein